MTFQRPWVLYLLVLVPALAALLLAGLRRDRKVLARFGAPELLRTGAVGAGLRDFAAAGLIVAAVIGLLVFAISHDASLDTAGFSAKSVRLLFILSIPLAYGALRMVSPRAAQGLGPGSDRLASAVALPLGRILKQFLIVLAAAMIVVALAGPQWGATREKITRKGVDVVVAVDASLSMLAQDVAPDRLAKAKAAVDQLIDLMKGDRIGLVVFAGVADVVCPITLDYDAAKMFLDLVNPRLVAEPGTNVSEALRRAAEAFEDKQDKNKVVILISDGEHLESGSDQAPLEVAKELGEQGVQIFTVGVGDPAKAASIPIESSEGQVDKVDKNGDVVITKIDEETLKKIALAAGGEYRRLDNRATGTELADIYARIAGLEKKTFDEEYQIHYEERFQWPLGAALVLLIAEMLLPERLARRKK